MLMANFSNREARRDRQPFNLCIHGGYTKSPSESFWVLKVPSPDGSRLVNTRQPVVGNNVVGTTQTDEERTSQGTG